MLTYLMILLAAAIAALVGYAARRPDTFRIERSINVDVAPEIVFRNINDFRLWQAWSPWEALDANLKRTYSGPDSGTGAAYAWVGDRKVGTGRMEIVESTSPRAVKIKLDFQAPFVASNTVDLTLVKRGDTTDVIWVMSGPAPFMSKLMGVVFNMDEMVGRDFEKGLKQLKSVSEGTGYTQLMR